MIDTNPTVFQSRLDIPPPTSECLNSPTALRAWLQRSTINTTAEGVMFGYTAGTLAAASPEDQDKPRFVFDNLGRYLGLAVWHPTLQGWTIGGQIGQLMTLVNLSGSSMAADLAARPMAGWHIADGGTAGIPNLRPDAPGAPVAVAGNAFFMGTGPNYSVYTVGFAG